MFYHRCTHPGALRRVVWRHPLLPMVAFVFWLLPLAACTISFNSPNNTTNGQGISEDVQVVQGQNGATLVLLPVTIHGKGPFTFALDTGASTSLISSSLAQQLGLPTNGNSQPISGIGGVEQAVFVNISNWNTGQIKLPAISIASAPIPHDRGTNFDGLLGSDIWNRFGKFTLDYSSSTLTVYKQIASAPDEQIAWLARRKSAAA
ncbi:MAG TPA: retropepsin-like aspartic protease [Ktedonobacterales bacterium]